MQRPYDDIAAQLGVGGDRRERMQQVVDLLWSRCHALDVSWVGFYLPDDAGGLVLGPRRDKPACSPIGLHGACGKAYTQAAPLIVRDVAELGADYIACDPRDRSEVVIPLVNSAGACEGVLDLDSYEVGAFDDVDVTGLTKVLHSAGLTHAGTSLLPM